MVWCYIMVLCYYVYKLLGAANIYTYICTHPYAHMYMVCFEIIAIAELED